MSVELMIRSCINRVPLCGCGSVEAMWEIVREVLKRSQAIQVRNDNWRADASAQAVDCKGFYDSMPEYDLSGTAVEFIAQVLDTAGFMEHGTSIAWAWPTARGKVLLAFLDKHGCNGEAWPAYATTVFESAEPFTMTDGEWQMFKFPDVSAFDVPGGKTLDEELNRARHA